MWFIRLGGWMGEGGADDDILGGMWREEEIVNMVLVVLMTEIQM